MDAHGGDIPLAAYHFFLALSRIFGLLRRARLASSCLTVFAALLFGATANPTIFPSFVLKVTLFFFFWVDIGARVSWTSCLPLPIP